MTHSTNFEIFQPRRWEMPEYSLFPWQPQHRAPIKIVISVSGRLLRRSHKADGYVIVDEFYDAAVSGA